ncbi:hypothetical protein ACIRBY_12700 [Streptomyces sp. NPDC096136]|uniref:hypothetical protein n=1 Tax=Streptomyces sp. NPDC096136 TaxID=3366076 RepID=UPI00382BFC7A
MEGAPNERTIGLRFHARSPIEPAWLSQVMVPVVRSLRKEHNATVAYLARGWKHGPHVELIARGPDGIPWQDIAGSIDWRLEELPEQMTGEQYLAQARELGRLERVEPPYLPLHPRGTLEFFDRQRGMTWPAALEDPRDLALTRMFTPLARLMDLAAGRNAGVPVPALAEAFTALCTAHPGGPAYGVFSLRSHAEAFLHWAGSVKDPRPSFARRLETDAPVLRAIVERARDGAESAEASEFRAAFAYGMGVFDTAAARGDLSAELLDGLAPAENREATAPPGHQGPVSDGRSEFHDTVAESRVTDRAPSWFASYRLLINLFYSRLPLLGVTPIQRYYLCFAIAETVDEVYGESWRERLRRAAERNAA